MNYDVKLSSVIFAVGCPKAIVYHPTVREQWASGLGTKFRSSPRHNEGIFSKQIFSRRKPLELTA